MDYNLEPYEKNIREFLAKPPFSLRFKKEDISLFIRAFTHTTFMEEYNNVHDSKIESYQRLEFLGDAILELVACDEAYSISSLNDEGKLTDFKQKAVANKEVAYYIKRSHLDLDKLMLLGNSYHTGDTQITDSLRADVFEALIAAVYLEMGLPVAKRIIQDVILTWLEENYEFP